MIIVFLAAEILQYPAMLLEKILQKIEACVKKIYIKFKPAAEKFLNRLNKGVTDNE